MANTTPHIRPARADDASTIAKFNIDMALETEDKVLPPETILAGVAAVLNDAAKGRYWVAQIDGQIIGQIMVTWEWSDWRNGYFWWIQSVYVTPNFRRHGVFSQLYACVKAAAMENDNACGLRLYVEKDNQRAQATYVALGMRDEQYRIYEIAFTQE